MADGGQQYQTKPRKLILEYFDTRAFKANSFHRIGKGLSERKVPTKNKIKSDVDDEQGEWDLHLNKFSFAENSAMHESTKQTPFEIMFENKP